MKSILRLFHSKEIALHTTVTNDKESFVEQPISCEPEIEKDLNVIPALKYEKDERSEKLIKRAIKTNDFLRSLMDSVRLQLVVDAMYPKQYQADEYIIRAGEEGSHLYVSAAGSFEVIKEGVIVKKFDAGEAFGELALLYNAKRLASVKTTTAAEVWVLDRKIFQENIMKRTGLQEQRDNIEFLSSVPSLQGLQTSTLMKISDHLIREFFPAGNVIVREGERGDKFYIIRVGNVTITKRSEDGVDKPIGTLQRGNYFGELALMKEDFRQATVTAQTPGVECLTIDRGTFTKYVGNLKDLVNKVDENKPFAMQVIKKEFSHVDIKQLNVVRTIGVGGTARVHLVQYQQDKNVTFALKSIKKVDVVRLGLQERVYNEKNIMFSCDTPFICKLYKTYRDEKYVHFLMEACLGGDLWTLLQSRHKLKEDEVRFIAACVVEAFEYLHERSFVYRDLKPENIMFDCKGYLKLVDFGYAKRVVGTKTWSFVGCESYVAPEIILNRGHGKAVDYWALGVLIYELLAGKPPFYGGRSHIETYNCILKGMDSVKFSSSIRVNARDLIARLCQTNPAERLGCLKNGILDIKEHKWFKKIDWDRLKQCQVTPPIVIPIKSPTDTSHFEKYPDEPAPPDETSGWDQDF